MTHLDFSVYIAFSHNKHADFSFGSHLEHSSEHNVQEFPDNRYPNLSSHFKHTFELVQLTQPVEHELHFYVVSFAKVPVGHSVLSTHFNLLRSR